MLRHRTVVVPPAVLHDGTAESIYGGMLSKLPYLPQGTGLKEPEKP